MGEIGPDFQISPALTGDWYQQGGYAKTPAAKLDISDGRAAADRADVFGKKAVYH